MRLGADARRILLVQALRAFAYGLGSVRIGVTLADLGLSGVQVGLVLGALVGGSALVSVTLARSGDRIGRRRWYVVRLSCRGSCHCWRRATWRLREPRRRDGPIYRAHVAQTLPLPGRGERRKGSSDAGEAVLLHSLRKEEMYRDDLERARRAVTVARRNEVAPPRSSAGSSTSATTSSR